MVVMFCFGLNVAGQHFSVVTQLFYIGGFWANVHSKLKLNIKVKLCVLSSCFYSSTHSNIFRLRTLSEVSVRQTDQENVTLIVSLEVQRGADVSPHPTVELLL